MDLYPVECLSVSLDRTKGFRSNNKDQQDKLFLSFVIPHKPVSSATLARWIKSYLQLAGIDTSIFSAHSLRGASTTAALNQGVSHVSTTSLNLTRFLVMQSYQRNILNLDWL